MAFKQSFLASLCLNPLFVASKEIVRHGLIGYGIPMYDPLCAFSCRAVVSGATLLCSTNEDGGHSMPGMTMGMGAMTEPDCYATDDIYLQTMAYCISTHCKDVPNSKLEKYWEVNIVGDQSDQPKPKKSYQQALASIKDTPTETIVSGEQLNKTGLVSDEDYTMNWNSQMSFERAEDTHERYG
jgi:hypothetical protein